VPHAAAADGVHPGMKVREDSIRLAKMRIKHTHEASNLDSRHPTDTADTGSPSTPEPGHKTRFRRASASEAIKDSPSRGFVEFLRSSLKLNSSKLNAQGQLQGRNSSTPHTSGHHTYHADAPPPMSVLSHRSKDGQEGGRRSSAPGDGRQMRTSMGEEAPQPAATPEAAAASAP
jgi:hypothetical protein